MKPIFSSRRNKSPHNNEEAEKKESPFFSKENKAPFFNANGGPIQAKLTVGQPGDKYEKEADSMADAVVSNTTKPDIQNREISSIQRESLATPLEDEKLGTAEQRMEEDKLVQEKPEVQKMEAPEEEEGMISKMEGEEEEEAPNATVQTKSDAPNRTASSSLSGKIANKSGKGKMLPKGVKSEMETSFQQDFSGVNIHTDQDATKMNKELGAQAFTHGKDIYFNSGKYHPETTAGKHLLAHELTHVVQQNSNNIRRTPTRVGTRFSHPTGVTSPHRRIHATFDGRDFKLFGDGSLLMSTSAQSGRPYSVTSSDATACGGSASDSYMNNPKYVGITDNGPIPEGTYRFRARRIATFDSAERLAVLTGTHFTDPFGNSLHGGDWGAGRVALSPRRIVPGPRGCGNTARRSGFYLHGGIMPGSSGCIDIANSGFDNMLPHLRGYRGYISVTVRYIHPAPSIGAFDRAMGRFTYPGEENPSILDRIESIFDHNESED
jgi:uncharacterized protein DUF4157/type VI secretion system (T6SS) effector TldE1-like protein